TGAINTSSISGFGGSVRLIAPAGVSVNGGITTSGVLGGGAVNLIGAPANLSGTAQVLNGYLLPNASFTALPVVSGSGAAVFVKGGINSSSLSGAGGAVTINCEARLQVGPGSGIYTSGLTGGGAVALSSINGAINVQGSVITSGFNIFNGRSIGTAG